MAEDAGGGAREHKRAAARGIAGRAGERFRNAVAGDVVGQEFLCPCMAGEGETGGDQRCDMDR
ncbi:hypothetical protein ACVW1A_005102 [Bradyrhizobium sp. LB1.3]